MGEPRRIDARRREIEAKYRALTEQLPAVTYVHPLGERGECLYISPQVSSSSGTPPERVAGAARAVLRALVHQEDRERVLGEIDETSADRALRTEYRMLARDGRVVWVRDEAVTVRDDEGRRRSTSRATSST